MEWQDLFSSNILDRGYDYYMSNNIIDIKRQSDILLARVKGEQEYHVQIDLNDMNHMTCDCQYFQSGNYCKHLAAVLFAFCDKPIQTEKKIIDVNEIIDGLNKQQLQQILKNLSSQNENIKNYVMTYSQNISLTDEHERIKDIFEHYRILEDLPDVFNQINHWLKLGYDDICFELVKDIYERLSQLVKKHEYFDICQNILEGILSHCNPVLFETIYQWLKGYWQFDSPYPMIENLLYEKNYFKNKLELKELLLNTYQQNQNRQDYFGQYRLKQIKKWIKQF